MPRKMKIYLQVVAFVILTNLIIGCAGIRDLYRNSNGDFGEVILHDPYEFKPGGFPGVARVNIDGFKYFGEQPFGNILNVHYNGLLSYGGFDTMFNILQSCPAPLQGRGTIPHDIMAIYWSNFVTGTVHSMPLEGENADQVLKDLNMTFNSAEAKRFFVENRVHVVGRNIGEMKKGVVFTWNNMKNGFGTNQVKNYLFQTVLVETENLDDPDHNFWFLQSYYASLDGNGESDRKESFVGRRCRQAQFGIGRRNSFTGIYTQPFSAFPFATQYFTNEYDFTDLASWVWDLSDGTMNQPGPPGSICDGTINEDPRCKILRGANRISSANKNPFSSPTSEDLLDSQEFHEPLERTTPKFIKPIIDALDITKTSMGSSENSLNSFCRYRDPGFYALPTANDVYVTCNIDGKATLTQCPKGTRFNIEVLACDHSHNVASLHKSFKVKGTTKPKPIHPHGNICGHHPSGVYPDPRACKTYYLCSNSRSIQMSCPDNLLFKPTSENKGYCDFIKNVECAAGGIRPSSRTSDSSSAENSQYHPRNAMINS